MLLRKSVYPYEYMDGWDKFNETSIPSKESFYSNLTMENITETDYIHANNVFKSLNLIIWVISRSIRSKRHIATCGCL